RHALDCLARLDGLALVSWRTMMTTTWIGIAISVAWLPVVESAVASPAVGPREAVEAAVVRVLSIVQDGQAAGAPVADRSGETRRGTEIPLDYRLHVHDGRWRIYDVVVGWISFVASYRTQFDRVIRLESYNALRERLQKKTLDAAAVERRPES